MKLLHVLCSLSVATALQPPSWTKFFRWKAPGPKDVRGPCPMLNTLANHGFLPRDGRNIDFDATVSALESALNIDPQFGAFLHGRAVLSNPTPNATTWSLETLRSHNVLEHDASLTRADYYFKKDAHTFDQAVYEETQSYWIGPIIDVQMAANARYGRIQTSNATNPTFELSDGGVSLGLGESAAYVYLLGDRVAGTVRKSWVKFLFEKEKLPLELGWRRQEVPFTIDELIVAMNKVRDATPSEAKGAKVVNERDAHGWA